MKSTRVSKIFAPTILLCLFSSPLIVGLTQSFAQAPDFKIRTQAIVASFNKMKHVTATKVYSDGTVEKFEGVFINRTEFNRPTDSGVSTFGLGVVGKPIEVVNGLKQDKFFFEMKR